MAEKDEKGGTKRLRHTVPGGTYRNRNRGIHFSPEEGQEQEVPLKHVAYLLAMRWPQKDPDNNRVTPAARFIEAEAAA